MKYESNIKRRQCTVSAIRMLLDIWESLQITKLHLPQAHCVQYSTMNFYQAEADCSIPDHKVLSSAV